MPSILKVDHVRPVRRFLPQRSTKSSPILIFSRFQSNSQRILMTIQILSRRLETTAGNMDVRKTLASVTTWGSAISELTETKSLVSVVLPQEVTSAAQERAAVLLGVPHRSGKKTFPEIEPNENQVTWELES